MKFYRYENNRYSDGVRVHLHEFDLIKETPKGYWIYAWGSKKWVSNSARKRFAYPTEQEARVSFIKRKERGLLAGQA